MQLRVQNAPGLLLFVLGLLYSCNCQFGGSILQRVCKDVKRSPYPVSKDGVPTIIVGVMSPEEPQYMFHMEYVREAVQIAMQKVDALYKNRFRLKLIFYTTACSNPNPSVMAALKLLLCNHGRAIIGPSCGYEIAQISRMFKDWDIPVVTPGGVAGHHGLNKITQYHTLTRVLLVAQNILNAVHTFLDRISRDGGVIWKRVKLLGQRKMRFNPGVTMDKFCHFLCSSHSKIPNMNVEKVMFADPREKDPTAAVAKLDFGILLGNASSEYLGVASVGYA